MKGQGFLPPGITLHDVVVWVDGFGASDRKKKTAYTFTDTTAGVLKHGGKAIVFNGTTALVDCGAELVGAGAVTVSCWCNPLSFGFADIGTLCSNGKFHLRINTTSDRINFSHDASTYAVGATNGIVPAAGTWYHIAATSNAGGNTGNIYLNGALNGTANQACGTAAAGSTNLIVGNVAAANGSWEGSITQFMVFNKVLTADQIAWIYNKYK